MVRGQVQQGLGGQVQQMLGAKSQHGPGAAGGWYPYPPPHVAPIGLVCNATLHLLKLIPLVMHTHGLFSFCFVCLSTAGISSAMRSMVVLEGVRSLWRGNGMVSATYGIEAAVMQFFVGQLKAAFAKDPANTTMAEKFFIGGTAGLIGISTVFPSYVLQARTAVAEPGRFQSYADLIRTSAAVDGPKKAFYSGYSAAAICKFPESGLHFLIYQVLKSTFVEPGQYPSVHQSLGFGAIGGFVR